VQRLVEALAAQDLPAGLEAVNGAMDAGADPRQLARQVVEQVRQVLLVRLGNAALVEVSAEARAVLARQAERLEVPTLLRIIRAFNTAANDARGGWQPQLPLELAVVECLTAPAAAVAWLEMEAPARPAAAPTRAAAQPPRPEAPPRPTTTVERPAGPRPTPAAAVGPASASAPAAPSGAGGDTRNEWNRLLGLVRERDKPTQALLNSCTFISLEAGVLRLATNEFVYKKINAEATRVTVETLLAEVLGHPCAVKFEVTSSGKRGRTARADDIPDDGMVATGLDLGGEIVE